MNFEINTEIRTQKIKKKEIKRTPINIFWFRRKFSILKTTIWIEINLSVRSDLKRNGYLFDMMKKKTFIIHSCKLHLSFLMTHCT